jgi:hypothetical protein
MSSLRELQRAFQRNLISGDAEVVDHVEPARQVSAQDRLDVYSQAYRIRLRDALASSYPRLEELLGAEAFDALARSYIDDHLSRFASIRWYGDRLAARLKEQRPDEPWLSELAQWEWALAAAFDAPDATPLAIETLTAFTPEQWPTLCFDLHPSLQRLHLETNAGTLYRQLSDSAAIDEPVALDEPRHWVLWRQGGTTRYRSIEPAERAALDAASAKVSFAGLCELLCKWGDAQEVPMRAATFLKRWLADGLIVAAHVGEIE